MVYPFELRRNLRSLLVPALAIGLVIGSIAIIVFHHALLGIGALIVTGYISYFLVKFFASTLRSHIRTSDEGLVCATATGSDSHISWDELTHAGWYTADSGYRELFVYAEGDDRLLTIPPQYGDIEALEQEIARRSGVRLLSLSGEDTDGLADALRAHIVPESELIDEESEIRDDEE
jgi:hypothetical protein